MTPPAAVKPPARRTRKALLWTLAFTVIFLILGLVSPGRNNPRLAWTFYVITALLLCWQGVLFFRAGGKSGGFAWEFVPIRAHYVQALVQLSIYVYWGWYWRNVYAEAPLILAQVAFLYIIDGLLTWTRGQTWRLGFGPLPVILSTNLFMWFRDDWFWFQFLMVSTGFAGRQLFRWKRDGKMTHIFNPAALGLTIFSLVLIITGTTRVTWGQEIATTLELPPHIYLWIFLCGIVVQYWFAVTLTTFASAGVLVLLTLAYTHFTGVYVFVNTNLPIAVFLGLHLTVTDPATSPRSSIGRMMFGGLYGVGVFIGFIVLYDLHLPEFYDKLLVVPFVNLLTPMLDRLAALGVAGKYGRWEAKVSPYKMNLAFMAGWTALFAAMLATGFVEAPHPGASIAFWKKAAEENRLHAVENLRLTLDEFERRNLDNTTESVSAVGARGPINRDQALGIVCDQVAGIYAEGKLVPSDPGKAALYFEKACEYGNLEGCANVAFRYLASTNSQPGKNVVRAFSLLEKSCAETPDGRVCYFVAQSYDLGRGNLADKAKARQFYEQGAGLGDLDACKNAARMELAGEGGSVNLVAAARWLQKAVDQQDGSSCFYLARMYHVGDGVSKDDQRAVALLEQACRLGVQPACEILKQTQH